MMTRDDVLRELELLPIWKLRTPVRSLLPTTIQAKEIENVKIAQTVLTANAVATVELEKQAVNQAIAPTLFEITISQDKHWAFVSESFKNVDLSGETNMLENHMDIGLQAILLENIMQALHVEKFTKIHTQNLTDINAIIIVAFGESVAQNLLKSQEKLENLHGKLHDMNDNKLIATHELAYLLAYPLNKADLWQDLCLARNYLQNLQS